MANRRSGRPGRPKIHHSYLVEEAAELLGVHKNTIRAWLKSGLPCVVGVRPTLIRGVDLAFFLAERKAARKRPCPPGHLFCFRCRVPRRPDLELVEYLPALAGAGNIRAMCPCCTALMHRRAGASAFEAFRQHLAGSQTRAESRISDCPPPRLNCDSRKAAE